MAPSRPLFLVCGLAVVIASASACGGSDDGQGGSAAGGSGASGGHTSSGSGGETSGGGGGAGGGSSEGHVTYVLDGIPYLAEAREGGSVTDVSAALDALSPRPASSPLPDTIINLSPDGDWLVVISERFDPGCEGWACAAVVAADFSQGEAVSTPSGLVHPNDVAVASGGDLVVFSDDDLILWASSRQGGGWSEPLAISTASSYAGAWRPAISDDGLHVVFDCGDEPFPAAAICEVGVDGGDFRVVRTRDQGPASHPSGPGMHHPDYAPDGSIVAEAEYAAGEQVWRFGTGDPELIDDTFTDDNSPCVLPDGRIASLWLNRPGSAGGHELKIMSADGGTHFMLLADVDVADVGLGCGR